MLLSAATVIETKELWEELQASLRGSPVRWAFEQTQIGEWVPFAEKLERLRPEVLFLDVSNLKDAAGTIQRIRALPDAPAIFVLHTHADSALILEAVRAGAGEYLFPPFGDALQAGLARVDQERKARVEPLRAGGKVLAFLSAKGGVGGTTLACHTAVELPRQCRAKVLLADLDLDTGIVGFLLKRKSPYSLLDAAANVHRLDSNYWRALVTNGIPGVEIVTAPTGNLVRLPEDPNAMDYMLRFIRTQYDWAIMDLGRGLSPFNLGVVQHSDAVFIVTTAEVPALYQAQQIVARLIEGGYRSERVHVLLNRPPRSFDLTVAEIEKMIGAGIYATIPNEYDALNESYSDGKLASPNGAFGKSIAGLARKLAGVQPEPKKKFSLF